MPPQRSDVWKHITLSTDKKTAKCNLCFSEHTYSDTTSNLRNHFHGKHGVTTSHQLIISFSTAVAKIWLANSEVPDQPWR